MEKRNDKSNEKIEKRISVTSSGDLQEYDEHISIMGSSKISGGKTHKSLRVSGSGKINGDLECNGLTSSGTLTGSGNLTSHSDISGSGSFNIAGFLYGDQNADFAGSTQIGNLVNIQGNLIASGSFEAGHFVRAEQGIELSGSSEINGNLSSEKSIRIDGSTNIAGNVVGDDILFGVSEGTKKKQHYKVHGSILAKNKVEVNKTHVDGDVKGKEIIVGKGSEILGTIYYVNKIEVDKKAKLVNEPSQIQIDEL
jgi:cytoskeletal protein CcmA (bactofilin family)